MLLQSTQKDRRRGKRVAEEMDDGRGFDRVSLRGQRLTKQVKTPSVAPMATVGASSGSSSVKYRRQKSLQGLTTLDSVIDVFAADTLGDDLCQAVDTLRTGRHSEIRNLCSKWGVQLYEKRGELGKWRKRCIVDLKDALTAKVLARANALHLSTLDSVIVAFANMPDGDIRQAANTLQAGTQHEIRDVCSMWGVQLIEKNESGKRRKRSDEDLVAELTAKVMQRANALHKARFRASDQPARSDTVIKGECVLDEEHASPVDPPGESPSLPKLNHQDCKAAYGLPSDSTGTVHALDEKAAGSGILHEAFNDVIDNQLQDKANADWL